MSQLGSTPDPRRGERGIRFDEWSIQVLSKSRDCRCSAPRLSQGLRDPRANTSPDSNFIRILAAVRSPARSGRIDRGERFARFYQKLSRPPSSPRRRGNLAGGDARKTRRKFIEARVVEARSRSGWRTRHRGRAADLTMNLYPIL